MQPSFRGGIREKQRAAQFLRPSQAAIAGQLSSVHTARHQAHQASLHIASSPTNPEYRPTHKGKAVGLAHG